MKIAHKLILGFLGIALLVAFLGYFSIRENLRILEGALQVSKISLIQGNAAREMDSVIRAIQIGCRDLLIRRYSQTGEGEDASALDDLLGRLMVKFDHQCDTSAQAAQSAAARVTTNGEVIAEDAEKDAARLLDEIAEHWRQHKTLIERFREVRATQLAEAEALLRDELEPHATDIMLPLIRRFTRSAERRQVEQIVRVQQDLARTTMRLAVSTVLCLSAATVVGWIISRSISLPLTRLKDAVLEVAKGELSTRASVRSRDEIGVLATAFNHMVTDLSRTTVSKSYVDNIIGSMADALLVLDPSANIELLNQASLDLLGYAADELTGRHIGAVLDEAAGEACDVGGLIRCGVLTNAERTFVTSEGHRIPVFLSCSQMDDRSGRLRGVVCVAKDITEFKEVQAQLRRARDELEARVDERTAQLAEVNEALQGEIAERKSLEREILSTSERERRQIGNDLHDGLGQSLTGIALMARALADRLRGGTDSGAYDAERIEALVNDAIKQTRLLVRGLCPVDLEANGIVTALEQLAESVTDVFGSSCRFEGGRGATLADNLTATHLYRIAQEAVSNAMRHGRARMVVIRLEQLRSGLVLTVEDDGSGIPADSTQAGGMGLSIMRYRATMIGAELDISARPGGGTVVRCEIPA